MGSPLSNKRFKIQSLSFQGAADLLQQDVIEGLFTLPRSLPPKYFYDDEGSKLFDQICNTQDYYPTRTEAALLNKYSAEIIELVNPKICTELGAGTSTKTEILLTALCASKESFVYQSIDVCEEVLVESANRLLQKYNNLCIESVAGEYIPAIQVAPKHTEETLYLFIGSSIGNFSEKDSVELLSEIANKMDDVDYFLIGMDRVKDQEILERAYNDSEGVTAKFNLNVLNVLNSKLGANFSLEKFSHKAIYNEQQQQIEMYLISLCDQKVNFPALGKKMFLEEGERILTEVSHKYTRSTINSLLKKSGLEEVAHFEPSNEYFSLVLVKKLQ
ncbi:MAG: L-histidine N(alpha)-methyltransferase [Gammaproteobacteria bacterium]